jgi:hypothetical protein
MKLQVLEFRLKCWVRAKVFFNVNVINPLKHSNNGIYIPPALTLKKLSILPTQCVYVFRMVLTINSDYFPKRH